LALGGAKNHLMVLPDAKADMTAQNVAASMSGCAGQRCMAAAAMVAVGNVDHIIQKICEEAQKIVPGKNLGAVINAASKERIERFISEAEKDGAKILVDGRNAKVKGKENGTYVGPTVIDYVKPGMSVATEEIFGPVISIMRTNTVDEALAIENANPYGNAASVFTQNGAMARYIIDHASAGMIGVNVGVAVASSSVCSITARVVTTSAGTTSARRSPGNATPGAFARRKSSIAFRAVARRNSFPPSTNSGSRVSSLDGRYTIGFAVSTTALHFFFARRALSKTGNFLP
jgi:acyl-CoA reductase-like NAD-dependent aldehyde dehydrogenase